MALDKRNITATESSLNRSGRRYSVKLRVYDISAGAAKTWSPILLGRKIEGVWHSGIEVYGYEYFYGGGIVKMKPCNVESTFGIRPSRVHQLGCTELSRAQFEKYLISIMPMFRKEVYDLVDWNCNHFTDHAARHLVSRPIPGYILDLPRDICGTFMGKMLMMFIRMTQGGSAPVAVDDPQHPSKLLESPGVSSSSHGSATTRQRRYSCPASPTHLTVDVSGSSTSRPATTSGDYKALGIDMPRRSSFAASTSSIQRSNGMSSSGGRRQHRLRTAPDGATNRHRQPQHASTPAPLTIADAARPRVSFCPGDEILGPVDDDELERVPGGMIGKEETAVVLSPKHRRLYEMHCEKVAESRHKALRMSVGRATRPTSSTSERTVAPSPLEPLVLKSSGSVLKSSSSAGRQLSSSCVSLTSSSLRLAPRTVPLQSVAPGEMSV